jgi:dihydrofolate reductase
LLGRNTYQGFAAHWPTDEWIEREGEFAERMNSYPKYVASKSLEEPLEWSNSQLLKGDVADEVRTLKDQDGRNILMYSSVELMQALMEDGLIDEYRIWVHPLVLGSGRHLFNDAASGAFFYGFETAVLVAAGIAVAGR